MGPEMEDSFTIRSDGKSTTLSSVKFKYDKLK